MNGSPVGGSCRKGARTSGRGTVDGWLFGGATKQPCMLHYPQQKGQLLLASLRTDCARLTSC